MFLQPITKHFISNKTFFPICLEITSRKRQRLLRKQGKNYHGFKNGLSFRILLCPYYPILESKVLHNKTVLCLQYSLKIKLKTFCPVVCELQRFLHISIRSKDGVGYLHYARESNEPHSSKRWQFYCLIGIEHGWTFEGWEREEKNWKRIHNWCRTNVLQLLIVKLGKESKTSFNFLSPGLGINVSLFCLGQFRKIGARLGSPGAGVEIGTGWKRALFTPSG